VGRPFIEGISLSNNLPVIDWTAISGRSYRLQYKPVLENGGWIDVSGDVTATGDTASKTDPDDTVTNRYYRVQALP